MLMVLSVDPVSYRTRLSMTPMRAESVYRMTSASFLIMIAAARCIVFVTRFDFALSTKRGEHLFMIS